jgi:phosphoglycerate dehydrogenase-like enzyme
MDYMSSDPRPKILVLTPSPLLDEIMSPRAIKVLEGLGQVEWNRTGRDLSQDEVMERIKGCSAVFTSWGPPLFDDELLDAAYELKIIGHAAGSIKRFIPPSVFERGVVVTHAANTIAASVAEWTLGMMLMGLRRVYIVDRKMQAGEAWPIYKELEPTGLYGKRVGIIGASHVGRALIRLLRPFDTDTIVYDPYLDVEDAAEMGVSRVNALDELMATSDVITNHAPTTEATRGMLDTRLWGLVKDGALFVNTARADAADYDALLVELQSGRFTAALDVFPEEPLANDSPFRSLPNVILSPHAAGLTIESKLRLGETVAEEFARYFNGEPLHHQVTSNMLFKMA